MNDETAPPVEGGAVVIPVEWQRWVQDIVPDIRLGGDVVVPEEVVFILALGILGGLVWGTLEALARARAA